jgi:hypothetical protein
LQALKEVLALTAWARINASRMFEVARVAMQEESL